jgi:hypothetical protein
VGPPDSHCSLSGAPSGACCDSARAVDTVHYSLLLLQTTVGAVAVTPLGTPDSPVNYSGEPFSETRSLVVGGDSPWYTRHCPMAHRTVRCARPGQPSVFLCSFDLNPFFYICIGLL